MKCAWTELLCLLPPWMRSDVDQAGKEQMQELRLRLAYPPELVCQHTNVSLSRLVTREDIEFVINIASRYSPWQRRLFPKGISLRQADIESASVVRRSSKKGVWQASAIRRLFVFGSPEICRGPSAQMKCTRAPF